MAFFRVAHIALISMIAGCAVASDAEQDNKIPDAERVVLETADLFDLLSLRPDQPREMPKDVFHGWSVLGRTTVKVGEARKKLVAAFKKGVKDNTGISAFCFNPRHGIRVTREDQVADFVICFECYQVKAYVGDQQVAGFLVTDSPEAAFDRVLLEAGVPLAEKPKSK